MKKKKQRNRVIRVGVVLLFLTVCIGAGLTFSKYYEEQVKGTVSNEFERITISVDKDMETGRRISWFTSEKKDWGNDLQVVEADKKSFWTAEDFVATESVTDGGISHQVYVSGLMPGTSYLFRAGNRKTGEFSKTGTFTTAKEADNCTFLALSDTQSKTLEGYSFSAESMSQGLSHGSTDFIINAGDMVDDGSKWEQWDSLIQEAEDIFRNHTVAGIGGNHSPQTDMVLNHFMLPNETSNVSSEGINYSFDYGSAHMIVMDTNESGVMSKTVSDQQIHWLREDVKKAVRQGAEFLILTLHKGPYTVGPHAPQEEIAGEYGIRNNLVPILEELGISLVIQGHDHIPSCTYPLLNGEQAAGGIVYLEMGAAGDKTYTINQELPQEYLSKFAYYDAKERESKTYHDYARISVSAKEISIQMYEWVNGQETLLYETKIQK